MSDKILAPQSEISQCFGKCVENFFLEGTARKVRAPDTFFIQIISLTPLSPLLL